MSPGATPPPQNELVRVEQARPVGTPAMPLIAKNEKLAKPTPMPKGKKSKKQKLESPPPVSSPAQPVVAQKPSAPTTSPIAVASAPTPPNIAAVTSAQTPKASGPGTQSVAQASSVPTATPVPVLPAQPVPADTSNVALASNAGGGSWKTFPPGKMPLGRLVGTGDLRDVAERGLAGERIYLKGQFVVNFSDANKAVLRPRTKLTDKVLHFGGGSSTRIIVEFPAGYTPPQQGAEVIRDEMRPYEITEVRKQEDGQLNVFVREIMQPH
ncbi:MAG: hypothetical protein DME99_01760 [Verrucomicrobia bacterium]|nr:MAG: hypothetical protein DME99_01760 [Verrucomicrobiota bacterium]